MFSKIITLGAILAAASANSHGHAVSYQNVVRHDVVHAAPQHYAETAHYAAPVANYADHYDGHDTYAHPQYTYAYSVADPHTGDHKSQHESRDGDVVHGYYNLAQPDGTVREVKYTAGHEGFNANVQYYGHSIHPQTYGHGHGQWN